MTLHLFVLGTLVVFSLLHGVWFEANEEPVSLKEGDSVTLHTDVKASQGKWYFNRYRITSFGSRHGDKICTDEECPERFRDRLTVDSHTGDLTITNIRPEDAGVYQLQISGRNYKSFEVSVQGVSADERDEVKRKSVKEGESVTLDPGGVINTNDSVTWCFNDTLIAEITGDQSQICTDDQCEERFRDRLKLDHQTGSLTIMNINTTDAGDYQIQIIIRIHHRHSITSVESFRVAVIAVPGSGLSAGAVAGVVAVLLVFAAAGVIYYRHRRSKSTNEESQRSSDLGGSQQHLGLLTRIFEP